MTDIRVGDVLLSSPLLLDSNFYQTVVLVTYKDNNGTSGLILNKPSGKLLKDCISVPCPPNLLDHELYEGGPVQPHTLFCLHQNCELAQLNGMPSVGLNLYFDHELICFQHAASHPEENFNFRFVTGYAGWSEGQLEEEFEAGSWLLRRQTTVNLMPEDSHTLYAELMDPITQNNNAN